MSSRREKGKEKDREARDSDCSSRWRNLSGARPNVGVVRGAETRGPGVFADASYTEPSVEAGNSPRLTLEQRGASGCRASAAKNPHITFDSPNT